MIGWILLGLVLLFILVLIVRTLRFKPLAQPPVAEAPVSLDHDKIVQDMADMIRCATVSYPEEERIDRREFAKFEALLAERFPRIYSACSFEKIGKTGLIPLFLKKSRGGDVRRSANRCQVSAQRCAGQKSEVKQVRFYTQCRGDTLDDRQHRRNIWNVIDKCGRCDRYPDNDRVQKEHIVPAYRSDRIRDVIDNSDLRNSLDDKKQSEQEQQCLIVNRLER